MPTITARYRRFAPYPLHLPALLWGVAGAALLLGAGGWAVGYQGLWMFEFLALIPLWGRLLLALLPLAAAFLSHSLATHRYFTAAIAPPAIRLTHPGTMLGMACLWGASGLLFWLLREQTLHGDGLTKLYLHQTASLQTDPYVWKEPLDSLLAYGATGAGRRWGISAQSAIAALSVLSGTLYVTVVLLLARHCSRNRLQRLCWILGLLATGSSLLWFGHVENYSLVTAFTCASVALALGALQGRAPLWLVGLTAGAAASFHPQAGFTFPALLLLLEWRPWRTALRQGLTLGLAGALVPTATVLAMIALRVPFPFGAGAADGVPGGELQIFWTAAEALAPGRIWDALNNLWLVAPLAPALVVAIGRAWARPACRRDRAFLYLGAVTAGMLFYHFTFQNELPRFQDWDLFAIVGPLFTLWGLYAWSRHEPLEPGPAQADPSSLLVWLAFALAYSGAWIGVNHHYTLVRPDPAHPAWFRHYLVDELLLQLPTSAGPCGSHQTQARSCGEWATGMVVAPPARFPQPVLWSTVPAEIRLPVNLPHEPSLLWFTPVVTPTRDKASDRGVTFQVRIEADGETTALWHYQADPGSGHGPHMALPLTRFRGRAVTLVLTAATDDPGRDPEQWAGWVRLWLLTGTLPPSYAQP